MDTISSPPPCPPTVTIRRNPPRKARATPASVVPLREPLSSPSLAGDIFSSELSQINGSSEINTGADPSPKAFSESLKIYLRIRPPQVPKTCTNMAKSKNAWPKNTKSKPNNSKPKAKSREEVCVQVNEDLCSVTVSKLQETKRIRSEVHEGFSRVFASEASQCDVYNEMVRPLVEDFIKGKSGMLAAMGPTGSGKTHTVFGTVRDPGMVPLALRHVFSDKENMWRVFSLSMFEISSEGGKERMIDLLHEGGNIVMQNSIVKGLQEAMVCDAQQAESLIAHGMFKRATASTNSNSQSSRSHCIINLRCSFDDNDEVGREGRQAMLTIVDLAGAEREKKTGNKGARLHESNFINNTSMVFSLCLRALLEHQKNQNKPLQKHYKSSLLTRYMQDYMEGKKRMMLILTVKPGVDDYLDTSFLLRQASPFTKIKYETVEGTAHLTCNKRPNEVLPRAEQLKKIKLQNCEDSLTDGGKIGADSQFNLQKESLREVVKDGLNQIIKDDVENSNAMHAPSNAVVELRWQERSSANENYKCTVDNNREYKFLLGLSKALFTVLKQYKKEKEAVEIVNSQLRDQLSNEKTRNLILEKELNSEKMRVLDLKNELKELTDEGTHSIHESEEDVNIMGDPKSLEPKSASVTHGSRLEISLQCGDDVQNAKETKYVSVAGMHARNTGRVYTTSGSQESQLTNASPDRYEQYVANVWGDPKNTEPKREIVTHDAPGVKEIKLACTEDSGEAHTSSGSLETFELTSACLHSRHNLGQDMNNTVEPKNLVVGPGSNVTNVLCDTIHLECESGHSSEDAGIPKEAKTEPHQPKDSATDDASLIIDDQNISVDSHTVISATESSGEDNISSHVDGAKHNDEEHEECPGPPTVTVEPRQARAAKNIQRCSNGETGKPKRRLLPASSVLLKDFSMIELEVKDENEKPKGGRRDGKKVALNDNNKSRTQGSLSLLNLLTNRLGG